MMRAARIRETGLLRSPAIPAGQSASRVLRTLSVLDVREVLAALSELIVDVGEAFAAIASSVILPLLLWLGSAFRLLAPFVLLARHNRLRFALPATRRAATPQAALALV